MSSTSAAELRRQLPHPVIDVDGHVQEFPFLLREAVLDEALQLGGPALARHVEKMPLTYDDVAASMWALGADERRLRGIPCPAWWALPGSTRDRAAAHLPSLLAERMDDLGIDLSVLYPSLGLSLVGIADPDVRRAACRAYNRMVGELYRPHADRLLPVALVPTATPHEALDVLNAAVNEAGLRAIVVGPVHRPVAGAHAAEHPELAGSARRMDVLGIDSDYDYDPLWARCEELGLAVAVHASGQGWGSRRSATKYAYNHIGAFAAAAEAVCKALFLGGVTRRFPRLSFAFLEGGAGWAVSLLLDLVAHWEKRGATAISQLDPARLDVEEILRLVGQYGPESFRSRSEDIRGYLSRPEPRPPVLDDWSACGIGSTDDLVELFTSRFFFGCEADDPLNALAFDTSLLPRGCRLSAVWGSDIGHWDVPDLDGVLPEAYELVEHGRISESDFADFVFSNPVRMYTLGNPDFFVGTRVEQAVRSLLPVA
jgi:predicted TIM-barrel fold metal-dependent hydrolase